MPRTTKTAKAPATRTSARKGQASGKKEAEKEVKTPIFETGQIFIVGADDDAEETFHLVTVTLINMCLIVYLLSLVRGRRLRRL